MSKTNAASSGLGRTLDEWLDYIEAQHPANIALGLDRVREVARRMGLSLRPARYLNVLVAGTNGKGTTVALLEAAAKAAELTVVTYTSPHVVDFCERLRFEGQLSAPESWVDAFGVVEQARASTPLTFFEFVTLAAMWLAERRAPDVAVFEIGMGGRLDAVNIIEPDASVVTTVAMDHMQWLGETLAEIAAEKAGVGRCRKPCYVGDRTAVPLLAKPLAEIGAQLVPVSSSQDAIDMPEAIKTQVHSDCWHLARSIIRHHFPRVPSLDDWMAQLDLRTLLPGRFETYDIVINGMPKKLVIDVSHNPQALASLANKLAKSGRGVHCVVGMLADKQPELSCFLPFSRQWYWVSLSAPRGQSAEELKAKANLPGRCYDNLPVALDEAMRWCGSDEIVAVFGSFLIVEEARKWVKNVSQ